MANTVMLVGGAGYIGSVCAWALRRLGTPVVTYDNLSTGHREAVVGKLIVGDIRDRKRLTAALKDNEVCGVMHFAAKALVGESTQHPLRYYDHNVAGVLALLDSMNTAGVANLVFSSTCAIYGNPSQLPLKEDHPKSPISPYGHSKNMVEHILSECRTKEGLRVTALRYFNAAGATPDGAFGESHDPETHLIPIAIDAALKGKPLSVFGSDYDTRDGTCVRDYVHVLDIAQAHILALNRLMSGDAGDAYNLGTGIGTTVLEVIHAIERATQKTIPHTLTSRRPGDPPALYASSQRITEHLGWTPEWPSIDDIVKTALTWAQNQRY